MSLARAGASLVELQQAGRWKSPEMPARYTRGESARRGPVARLRHGQEGERRREAGDGPDICNGIPAGLLADATRNVEKEPRPDDGLTPGIRVNGNKAGIASALLKIWRKAMLRLAVAPQLGNSRPIGKQESTGRREWSSSPDSGSRPGDSETSGMAGISLAAGFP